MRRRSRSRRVIPFGAALATVIALLVLSSAWPHHTTEPNIEEPVDFYAIAREASLSELVQVADKTGIPLYLPSTLPYGLKLTVIYLHEDESLKEGEAFFFIAIVVYSAEGNKDYKTAELGIEIVPSLLPPTYEQLQTWAEKPELKNSMAQALVINGWPVMVYERAYTGGHEERRAKYGDYTLLVTVWIEGNEYRIGAPTLTPNGAIQLVWSMRPIA